MTKVRAPLSPHDAVLIAAELLGWPRLAQIAGRNERTVRRWSEPDLQTRLPFETALAIDIACREAGAGEPFAQCFRLGQMMAEARTAELRGGHAECAAYAARETGEAIAAHFELQHQGGGLQARLKA